MVPHRFGESPAFSVGLEEELFVLDGETLEPASVPEGVLDGERLKPELFTTMLELNTSACTSVGEAVEELAALRLEARRRLREHGLELAAAGTWPSAVLGTQPVTPLEPLQRFADYAGASALRQHCCGLHVHVGVASPRECMGRLEAVLPWLPLLLALLGELSLRRRRGDRPRLDACRAAHAPAARGRAARFCRLRELGRALRSYWSSWALPTTSCGSGGTSVPIRASAPSRSACRTSRAGSRSPPRLRALAQALVAWVEPAPFPADRGLYAQNRWAAARFGADAGLVHPEAGRLCTPGELLAELLERLEPVARRLGADDLVGGLEGLDQAGTQLEIGRSDGVRALCERLVALTYDGL